MTTPICAGPSVLDGELMSVNTVGHIGETTPQTMLGSGVLDIGLTGTDAQVCRVHTRANVAGVQYLQLGGDRADGQFVGNTMGVQLTSTSSFVDDSVTHGVDRSGPQPALVGITLGNLGPESLFQGYAHSKSIQEGRTWR